MDSRQLRRYMSALGSVYLLAVQELNAADLRTYFLHEAEWLRHQRTPVGEVDVIVSERVRQARDYLHDLLALRRPRKVAAIPGVGHLEVLGPRDG